MEFIIENWPIIVAALAAAAAHDSSILDRRAPNIHAAGHAVRPQKNLHFRRTVCFSRACVFNLKKVQ